MQSKDAQRRLEGIRQSQEKRTVPVAETPATEAPCPPIDPTISPAPSPTPAASMAPKTERPAAADMAESAPVVPAFASHPLIVSWREAHDANLHPGSAITVGERNRRVAVALADKAAAAELARLAPATFAEATAQAAANQRYLQRVAGRSGPSPQIR